MRSLGNEGIRSISYFLVSRVWGMEKTMDNFVFLWGKYKDRLLKQ